MLSYTYTVFTQDQFGKFANYRHSKPQQSNPNKKLLTRLYRLNVGDAITLYPKWQHEDQRAFVLQTFRDTIRGILEHAMDGARRYGTKIRFKVTHSGAVHGDDLKIKVTRIS